MAQTKYGTGITGSGGLSREVRAVAGTYESDFTYAVFIGDIVFDSMIDCDLT